jgi:hypothetical protein
VRKGGAVIQSVADIKPWFRDDFERTLASIYFAFCAGEKASDRQYRADFVSGLAAFALAVGADIKKILSPEDMQLLAQKMRGK